MTVRQVHFNVLREGIAKLELCANPLIHSRPGPSAGSALSQVPEVVWRKLERREQDNCVAQMKAGERDRKKTWQRRMEAAQKEHRPKLQDWDMDGFGHVSRRKGTFDLFACSANGKGVNNRKLVDMALTADVIMVPLFCYCYRQYTHHSAHHSAHNTHTTY